MGLFDMADLLSDAEFVLAGCGNEVTEGPGFRESTGLWDGVRFLGII